MHFWYFICTLKQSTLYTKYKYNDMKTGKTRFKCIETSEKYKRYVGNGIKSNNVHCTLHTENKGDFTR